MNYELNYESSKNYSFDSLRRPIADEYDTFSNDYLEPYGTAVEQTFRSFWSMVKVLHTGGIEKVFITGISPLSFTDIDSGFNVGRNLSSDEDVAAVCGLRRVDMEAALRKLVTRTAVRSMPWNDYSNLD
ncbi:putative AAA-ATPase domain containing protein [Elaphomyces granulatus]|jgi:hypothetical protein